MGIDADECARGLWVLILVLENSFSFASTFEKLKEVYESEGEECDDRDIIDAGVLSNNPSYYDALRLLTYSLQCQVYPIALQNDHSPF